MLPRSSAGAIFATIVAVACSRTNGDERSSAPADVTAQARAVQSAIASAQTALPGVRVSGAPTPDATPPIAVPPVAMPPSSPSATSWMLGRPPPALPATPGAPHLYHVGAESFFLEQAAVLSLTNDQISQLTSIREKATLAMATAQRQIDQAEQDLWVLTSSEAPDAAKIDAKITEIARVQAQERIEYVRAVGAAISVLTQAQRKAAISAPTMPSAPVPTPAPGAVAPSSAMPMGSAAAPGDSGMNMDNMGTNKPPQEAMPDAGPSGNMGHM